MTGAREVFRACANTLLRQPWWDTRIITSLTIGEHALQKTVISVGAALTVDAELKVGCGFEPFREGNLASLGACDIVGGTAIRALEVRFTLSELRLGRGWCFAFAQTCVDLVTTAQTLAFDIVGCTQRVTEAIVNIENLSIFDGRERIDACIEAGLIVISAA